MILRFHSYDTDDWADLAIGYSPAGYVLRDAPRAVPASLPVPGEHGGQHTAYLLQMAQEVGEFTVRDVTTRFGLAHQGASFYATLAGLVTAGLLVKRVGKANVGYYRGAELPSDNVS